MKYVLTVLSVLMYLNLNAQDIVPSQSVLSEGTWKRFAVIKEGVYSLTPADLPHLAGKPYNQITFRGMDWGDLPQANNAGTPLDPPALPIEIKDNGDGIFSTGDIIFVYLRPAHRFEPVEGRDVMELDYNHYSDTAWYYAGHVTPTNASNQILGLPNLWNGQDVINTFEWAQYYRADKTSRLSSGRDWYGEFFSASAKTRLYSFEQHELATGSEVRIAVSLLGYTFQPASYSVRLNSTSAGNLEVGAVPDDRYAVKGQVVQDTFRLPSAQVTGKPEIFVEFSANTSSRISEGYMDHLIYQIKRPLTAGGSSLAFFSYESAAVPMANYEINISGNITDIWDVTHLFQVAKQEFAVVSGKARFGTVGGEIRRYIAFDKAATQLKPAKIVDLNTQNLKGISPVDLLILAPSKFIFEAERLADFRRNNEGIDVVVVDIGKVYNEFSASRKDVSGIRNFIRYMNRRNDAPGKLKYVLLFGKGTYDFKNITGASNNHIPVYQSRNSLHPLLTYGSDDYYGFMDASEGEWQESSSGDHDLDVAIGRLPVISLEQARGVVDKLIRYGLDKNRGKWKSKVVFVADDGDFNVHQNQSDQLADLVESGYPGIEPYRLFLDNYVQNGPVGSDRSPEMEEQLSRAVNEGALIVNFTGHGGPGGWMQESILSNADIIEWDNKEILPLFVTATCEFGRHDSPFRISGGEDIINNPNGGGIGLVTTSRPVFSSTNFILNKAFYNQVFSLNDGVYQTIGEVFLNTKNNSTNGISNRNFSLLGDPSMKLAYPELEATVTSLNGQSITDGGIDGLGEHILQGEIRDFAGNKAVSFDGEVSLTVYDRPNQYSTLGNENPVFNYDEWGSRVFSGKALVESGEFEISFVAPVNISDEKGPGKISLYATTSSGLEAWGTNYEVRVGGQASNPGNDEEGPAVKLFLNDKTFREGGVTAPDTRLIVEATDVNGIGISDLDGLTRNVAILDGEKEFELNPYFLAEPGNYGAGNFELPLFDLSPGRHEIETHIYDTYANHTVSNVVFYVSEGEAITVKRLVNTPNPFQGVTTLSFEHNQPGKDLFVRLDILSPQGQKVFGAEYLVQESPSVVELETWDARRGTGQTVGNGLYFAVIQVTSLSDGTKNTAHCKLIYLN